MRKDKEEVIRLRKLGKSYNEIRQQIRIPKSTLLEWLGRVGWSKKIHRILAEKAKLTGAVHLRKLDKVRGRHLRRVYEEARREARDEFKYLKLHPLFIAGVSIYWGEGDRVSKSSVRLGNTDPSMIRLFVKFLRDVCGIHSKKIFASVLVYPDLNQDECRSFWVNKSGLPESSFNKCIVMKGRHKTWRIRYGVCTVGASSTYLKEKLRIWLKLLPKEFSKKITIRGGSVIGNTLPCQGRNCEFEPRSPHHIDVGNSTSEEVATAGRACLLAR